MSTAQVQPDGPASGEGPVVAITGAARGIGHAVAAGLAASGRPGKVVAIDAHRGDVPGATWRLADVCDPALAARLTGVDVLLHTDTDTAPDRDHRRRRAFNVRGAQTVLTAAAAVGIRRVILLTSAMVYGARPDNDLPLPESAPLRAEPDGSVAGDMLEIEQLARRATRAHPGTMVTVVRPAAVVGPQAEARTARYLDTPRLLAVKGCPLAWQFCHTDDLVSALELAVAGEIEGDFAVGSDGWLAQDELEQVTGLHRIELPAALTLGTAQRLHRIGIAPGPLADLRYLVYPWVVDCARLRAVGWRPRHSNAAALRALAEARAGQRAGLRMPPKEATLTAAGATVAVLGTAAIVRAARRRRHGA